MRVGVARFVGGGALLIVAMMISQTVVEHRSERAALLARVAALSLENEEMLGGMADLLEHRANLSYTLANYAQQLRTVDGKVPEKYLKDCAGFVMWMDSAAILRNKLDHCHRQTIEVAEGRRKAETSLAIERARWLKVAGDEKQVKSCRQCNPPPLPDRGRLSQFVYHRHGLERMPVIGNDHGHPWQTADLIPRTTKTEEVVLLSDDPTVEQGNVSACQHVDVIFHQASTFGVGGRTSGRCMLMVPERNAESFAFTVPMDTRTGKPAPRMPAPNGTNVLGDVSLGDSRHGRLLALLERRGEMVDLAIKLVEAAVDKSGNPPPVAILVMCANDGHLGLLLNFACGLKHKKISMPIHLIFVANTKLRDQLVKLGFTVFYDTGLGSFPDKAARVYADDTFGKMMYLKQFSTLLALDVGYDVLFQDVDVLWLKDPIPGLREASRYYHGQFQDDQSRQFRFQPWFANSGFMYFKQSNLARQFWDHVTMLLPNKPRGNQIIVNEVLDFMVRRHDFKARTLPQELYVSGGHVSHITKHRKGHHMVPLHSNATIVHFCWTADVQEKLEKMVGYALLFVPQECLLKPQACFEIEGASDLGEGWQDVVCQAP